jgi:hypothetical protein
LLTADEIGYDLYDPNQRNLDAGSPADSSRETVADLTDLSLGTVAVTTLIVNGRILLDQPAVAEEGRSFFRSCA